MNAVMVHPTLSSEKAIANYAIKLVDNLNNQGLKIDSLTYTAGQPKSLFKQLNRLRKDEIIHLQHEYNLLGFYALPFFIILLYLSIFKKGKLVVTMHTVLSKKEKLKGSFVKRFLRKYILYPLQNRLINLASNKIIVHAEFFKKILIEEYKVPAEKITVFPQGIEENPPIINKEIAKKELNIKGNAFLIIGSFVPDHGADLILKQANKIGKTILTVVNPNAVNDRNKKRISDWLEYNKNIVNERHFEKFVRFDIGPVPYELWWKYISAADIVLLPYRGGIGSGVVTDAIAANKPMVGSNIQFFKEMENRFKFIKLAKDEKDYSEEIKKAMIKKNYLKMQSECKKYIAEFGLSALAKKYKRFYASL